MFKKIVINSIFAATLISAGNVIADPTPTTWQAFYQAQNNVSLSGTIGGYGVYSLAISDLSSSGGTNSVYQRYEYPKGNVYYAVYGIPTVPNIGWSAGASCGDINLLNSWYDNSGWLWEQGLTVPALANNQSGTATYTDYSNYWLSTSYEVTCSDGIIYRSN